MNFWGYLIEGLTGVLGTMLNQLPVAGTNTILGSAATILYFAIAPLLIMVGSFVNLEWFAIAIETALALTVIKAVISAVRWVYKLIPGVS